MRMVIVQFTLHQWQIQERGGGGDPPPIDRMHLKKGENFARKCTILHKN